MPDRDRMLTVEELWAAFRAVRHDFYNLKSAAEAHMVHPFAPDMLLEATRRLEDIVERLEKLEQMQMQMGLDEMSPRERGTYPAMARSWILHGEAADLREEATMHRMRVMNAYATMVQAIMAVVAVVLAYLVSHH